MKKKIYSAPQQTVVILKSRTCLLAGSAAQAGNFRNGGNIWEDEDYDNE